MELTGSNLNGKAHGHRDFSPACHLITVARVVASVGCRRRSLPRSYFSYYRCGIARTRELLSLCRYGTCSEIYCCSGIPASFSNRFSEVSRRQDADRYMGAAVVLWAKLMVPLSGDDKKRRESCPAREKPYAAGLNNLLTQAAFGPNPQAG